MGSPRTEKRKESRGRMRQRQACERKRVFKKRNDARIAAERATGNYGTRIWFYRCPICKDHHLTSSNKKINYSEDQPSPDEPERMSAGDRVALVDVAAAGTRGGLPARIRENEYENRIQS